jgi:hypothetical protein
MAGRILATGGGAVLREANRQVLHQHCHVFYLKASPEELYQRLRNDKTRPLLQVDDPAQRLRELFEARDALYAEIAHYVIDSARLSSHQLLHRVAMQAEMAGIVPARAALNGRQRAPHVKRCGQWTQRRVEECARPVAGQAAGARACSSLAWMPPKPPLLMQTIWSPGCARLRIMVTRVGRSLLLRALRPWGQGAGGIPVQSGGVAEDQIGLFQRPGQLAFMVPSFMVLLRGSNTARMRGSGPGFGAGLPAWCGWPWGGGQSRRRRRCRAPCRAAPCGA